VRALLLVLDSVGIGHAPDAADYGDAGANTLGHILERVPNLQLPNLLKLGLPELVTGAAQFQEHRGRAEARPAGETCFRMSSYAASFGKMQERSAGKDTTTGHWEIAGVVLDEPFAVYERFPDELVRASEREAGVEFIGNSARSGTTILAELGAEHVRTGKPILYASADCVLQIAAHEEV
jgi:phosphopentomutase